MNLSRELMFCIGIPVCYCTPFNNFNNCNRLFITLELDCTSKVQLYFEAKIASELLTSGNHLKLQATTY